MSELTKADVQRIVAAKLEELGLARLSSMFGVEHHVPRGTHKAGAISSAGAIDADTLDGQHASAFALVGHTHSGSLSGDYDSDYKALVVIKG